jgi:hypothetical protein
VLHRAQQLGLTPEQIRGVVETLVAELTPVTPRSAEGSAWRSKPTRTPRRTSE